MKKGKGTGCMNYNLEKWDDSSKRSQGQRCSNAKYEEEARRNGEEGAMRNAEQCGEKLLRLDSDAPH